AQVSDTSQIDGVVAEVLAANAGEVERFRAGEEKVFGFLMGQVMKALKGQGNPDAVRSSLAKALSAGT
ncbi:MAG: Asp-tRNA(Asn)/Glu-tRNA(Gln) amidotransferase GatCAB subunit B, partial [Actinomycetota bacterium]